MDRGLSTPRPLWQRQVLAEAAAAAARQRQTMSIARSELESTTHDRHRRRSRQIAKLQQQEARRYGMREKVKFGRSKYTHQNRVYIVDDRTNHTVTSWRLDDRNDKHRRGHKKRSHSTKHVSWRHTPLQQQASWNHRRQHGGRGGGPGPFRGGHPHPHRPPPPPLLCGTRRTVPLLLAKRREFDTPEMRGLQSHWQTTLFRQHDKWRSHTVLVVDMSGSMRTDDIDGARCRSDAVFYCWARHFIQQHMLERNGLASIYDVVSCILMRETSTLLFQAEPVTWVLYNRFVELREWEVERPSGPGNYIPALEIARKVLRVNPLGSCTLHLFFISDGRPSDRGKGRNYHMDTIPPLMGEIGQEYGRRLVLCCVGMAHPATEDFQVLKAMVQQARANGVVKATFEQTDLRADALSRIIASQAMTLSNTRDELSSTAAFFHHHTRLGARWIPPPGQAGNPAPVTPRPMRPVPVRTDLRRESVEAALADDGWRVHPAEWRVFGVHQHDHAVGRVEHVWVWNTANNDLAKLVDPRCGLCERVVVLDEYWKAYHDRGQICPACKACAVCWHCWYNDPQNPPGGMGYEQSYYRRPRRCCSNRCAELAHQRRRGFLVMGPPGVHRDPVSYAVAWKRTCFEEGAERVAYVFRHINAYGDWIGPKYVAKESRFATSTPQEYHIQFLRAQHLAAGIAQKFNSGLEFAIHQLGQGRSHGYNWELAHRMPRIRFLEPVVYGLKGITSAPQMHYVLVEHMLSGFRKYTNNDGKVFCQTAAPLPRRMQKASEQPGSQSTSDAMKLSSETTQQLPVEDEDKHIAEKLIGHIAKATGKGSNAAVKGAPQENNTFQNAIKPLDAIVEEDESEGQEDQSMDEGENQTKVNSTIPVAPSTPLHFDRSGECLPTTAAHQEAGPSDEDFLLAFSHYSYEVTGGRFMVVDLQGNLSVRPDGTREFILTDPAVHSQADGRHMSGKLYSSTRTSSLGKTDRGITGMRAFFRSHRCNRVCRFLELLEDRGPHSL